MATTHILSLRESRLAKTLQAKVPESGLYVCKDMTRDTFCIQDLRSAIKIPTHTGCILIKVVIQIRIISPLAVNT